jgi:ABC-2 type transport system ATP-binding protein
MKMITGFSRPTSGQVSIHGHDIVDDRQAAQARLGYLPEGAPCYEDMTVQGFLAFIADIRGCRDGQRDRSIDRVTETVSLREVLGQRIETLSKGYKRRVGLAQALLHDPDVLILDEPTDGLDPNQKHQVREMILNLSEQKIVIISTHILEEVSAVCSRALIINQGRIVLDDTPDGLRKRAKDHQAIRLRVMDVDPSQVLELCETLPSLDRIETSGKDGDLLIFPKPGSVELLTELQQLLSEKAWQIARLQQLEGQLDEVFRRVTMGDAP